MIRVLMVDDHHSVLTGVKTILEKHGMQVTLSASPLLALELLEQHTYDIHLYDLNMPIMNGMSLSKLTLDRNPDAVVVIITGDEISQHFNLIIHTGIAGIISKSYNETEMLAAIQLALNDKVVLPRTLVRQLRFPTEQSPLPLERPLIEKELEILNWISLGKKNKEIAEIMFTGQRNVEHYLTQIFQKLGVSSRYEAIQKASALELFERKSPFNGL
ncbi:response regulator transcription factor [Paenibacillus sp. SYP-B3998]|uniref:Response regulator transcription factor n=1 Tax=Paenibacillus sp. SYP-B3998 TaxID=2678564 RepID=A0A6G3ZWV7_9BACL|nr:response regulator transcription factor [Paenibacillus sp. SYP-B3998]NEW06528.1 response regulator transcription factor [Paenibacillus sp. SYP-B3998]